MSDTRVQIRVGSSAECMDADVSGVESLVDMCNRIQQSEGSYEKCIILIHFFGGYSISEVLHAEHSKGTRSGQIESFLLEREC